MVTSRARRIAILRHSDTSESTELVGLITPTDILAVLADNLGDMGSLGAFSINTLFPMAAEGLQAAPSGMLVKDVLIAMLESDVMCVPIINDAGAIVGVFSLSDTVHLGGMSEEDVEAALQRSVLWFASKREGNEVVEPPMPPITMMPRDTLTTAVSLLFSGRIHQVFVVDEERRPVGAISIHDVLAVVMAPHVLVRGPAGPIADIDTHAPATDVPIPAADEVTATAHVPSSAFVTLTHRMTVGELATLEKAAAGVTEDLLCISVEEDTPLCDVVKTMRDHGLHTVPVHRKDGDAVCPDDRRYIGWISPLDIVALRLEKGLQARGVLKGGDVAHMARVAADWSHTDPFYAVLQDVTVSQALAIVGGRSLVSALECGCARGVFARYVICDLMCLSLRVPHRDVMYRCVRLCPLCRKRWRCWAQTSASTPSASSHPCSSCGC